MWFYRWISQLIRHEMASTGVRERERIDDDDDDSDVDHHKDVLLRAEEVHQMHGHQDEVM